MFLVERRRASNRFSDGSEDKGLIFRKDVMIEPLLTWFGGVGEEPNALHLPHLISVRTHPVDGVADCLHQCTEALGLFHQVSDRQLGWFIGMRNVLSHGVRRVGGHDMRKALNVMIRHNAMSQAVYHVIWGKQEDF